MTKYAIKRAGEPILRTPVQPVAIDTIPSDAFQQLIKDMFKIMKEYNGVGLAAPQIGLNQSVLVYGFESNLRYPNEKPVPQTVLINPTVLNMSDEKQVGFEGCLSLDSLRGEVPRATSIEISAYDAKGQSYIKKATGFEARIIQHELDHLNGHLIIDRMPDFKHFGFTEVLLENKII